MPGEEQPQGALAPVLGQADREKTRGDGGREGADSLGLGPK